MLVLCHFVRQELKHDAQNAPLQHVWSRGNLLNLSGAEEETCLICRVQTRRIACVLAAAWPFPLGAFVGFHIFATWKL